MTRPAAASRVAVTGLSFAGTLVAVAGFSWAAQAEEAEKAREQAAAMRKWNAEQAKRDRKAREWAKQHPVVVTRTVYRKVYVPVAGEGSGPAPMGGSPSYSNGSTSGSSSTSGSPSPAPAPAAPAPAAPAPTTGSGGS